MKKLFASLLFTGLIASTAQVFAACPCGVSCPSPCPVSSPACPVQCQYSNGAPAMTAPQAAACPKCRYLLKTCECPTGPSKPCHAVTECPVCK